jgi:Flp pilus assembly protein TadG
MAAMMRRLRRSSESGAELVEFAIIAPVLLLMMASIVDFALLFHSFQVTTNAAREGARLAVLPGYDANGYSVALDRVDDYIQTGGARGAFSRTAVPELVDLGGGLSGGGVRVTVTYTHEFIFIGSLIGLMNGTFQDSLSYTTSSLMRNELQAVVGP